MTDRWWEGPLWGLDFETTGRDPETARPVSVGFWLIDPDGTIVDGIGTLVNPEIPISAEATAVHGITDEQAAAGMTRTQALGIILSCLVRGAERIPLVIMNATYDWSLMLCEADRLGFNVPHGQPIVDPIVLDRWLDKYRKGGRKLVDLAKQYRVTLPQEAAHDATRDVIASVAVARAIAKAWGPAWNNAHEGRRYQETDLHFPALQRHQRTWYAIWREGANAYWRRENIKDGDKIREMKGEWPTGTLAIDPARGYGPQEIRT